MYRLIANRFKKLCTFNDITRAVVLQEVKSQKSAVHACVADAVRNFV